MNRIVEIVAWILSLPVALWRASAPRKYLSELVTYSIDGMEWPDLPSWRLEVSGEVEEKLVLDWDSFRCLPRSELKRDFHCITGWSVLDVTWEGVLWKDFLARIRLLPGGRFVRFISHGGYSASFSLQELEGAILADTLEGQPLAPERGGPLRLVAPELYGYKSVKGLRRIEITAARLLGFWELWGYGPSGKIGATERKRIARAKR
ncbi:MAG: molybdopterin-dependent oxidoreductase [Candidatus Eremiobacteraeota bacterium]|nr:molybdopterin-dependent oxidoreductase [Candidatus Eremiobacteraeota bacterium]